MPLIYDNINNITLEINRSGNIIRSHPGNIARIGENVGGLTSTVSSASTVPPIPECPRLFNASDIVVYYDTNRKTFVYMHRGAVTFIGQDENIKDFYSLLLSRGFHIVPEAGSVYYAALIHYETYLKENEMRSRAKPANEFAWTINYNKSLDAYEISPPTSTKTQRNFVMERHNTLEDCYKRAIVLVERTRNGMLPSEAILVNVWPTKQSNYYKMLLEKQVIDIKITEEYIAYNTKNVIEDLNYVVKNQTAPDVQIKLRQIVDYMNYHKFGYEDNAIEWVIKQLKNKGLPEYIKAYNMREVVFIPLSEAKRVYKTRNKKDGYEYFTNSYVVKNCKICENCKDIFASKNLVMFQSKRLKDGLYCNTCLNETGHHECANGCTAPSGNRAYHHEDDGCQLYNMSNYEHIYNYSKDVRSLIYKMQHTKVDKKINGDFLHFGVELEVLPRSKVARETAAYNCGKALRNHAILKDDSSLRAEGINGFEIVTIPATLRYHRETLWKKFFAEKYSDNLTAAKSVHSWDTQVCGIHVHVTRACLTEMQLSKLLVFYNEPPNSNFLSRIAGRTVGPNAVYCKAQKKKLRIGTSGDCGDHHGAISISQHNKGKTAEVRIFRGNCTFHGIMRAIEFVDATVKWCANNASNDVTDFNKFLEWFKQPEIRSQYPELRKHLIELKYIKPRQLPDRFKDLDVVSDELRTA